MKRGAYYNEIDPYCVEWLRNLIAAGLIPAGDVDSRSIEDVTHDDLAGYAQCHFFAGLGGWAYATSLAGWPDERPIWTGSCPCQPFSVAGKGGGTDDPRHLWPHLYRLVRGGRPPVLMGEQVAGAAGYDWFDGVRADLEAEGYQARAVDIPAASVNAPHQRNRLYWVADTAQQPQREPHGALRPESWQHARTDASGSGGRFGGLSDTDSDGRNGQAVHVLEGRSQQAGDMPSGCCSSAWSDWQIIGPDRDHKYRRIKPGITPLAPRLPGHVGQLRAFGNAICAPLAAEVIRAYMEAVDAALSDPRESSSTA